MAGDINDDATGIDQTKTLDKNSYLGTVEVMCKINKTCPFTHDLVDSTMVLDSRSLVSLPDFLRQNFGSVPGLPGVYLKEIYRYRSNWLMFGATDAITGPNPVAASGEETLNPTKEAIVTAPDDYKKHQMWTAVPSPVDNLVVPKPSQLKPTVSTGAIKGMSGARFEYITPSRPIEGNEGEATDSTVLAISQTSTTQATTTQTATPPSTGQTGRPGIHWKVTKNEVLFKGEDFFIEFIGTVIQPDLSKTESKVFANAKYNFLDANFNGAGGGKKIPKNFGVAPYTISSDGYFQPDSQATQRFNFCRQTYAIVEMGGSDAANNSFFILLPYNYNPTFIKVVDGVSYNLSVFDGTSCKELFGRTSFRMTVRNHLGYIVITFDGYEDIPWIISNDIDTGKTEDAIFRVPDKCKLSVWGGNSPMAFIFAPLQYGESSSLDVPPSVRTFEPNSGAPVLSKNYFILPKKGVTHYFFLSSSDICPKGISKDNKKQALDYTKFLATRDPYYTCDASDMDENGVISGIGKTKNCYFTENGIIQDYIKATIQGTGQKNPKLILKAKVEDTQPQTTSTSGPLIAITGPDTSGRFAYITTTVTLISGDHDFGVQGSSRLGSSPHIIKNCKTPIATHVRALAVPNGDSVWEPDEKDVSKHVIHFKDAWSSSDFNTCEHTGDISFLLDPSGGDEGDLDQTTYLEGLKDKMFYIEVWARYSTCSYAHGTDTAFYKLFTGMCPGGTIKQQPVERVMECKLLDYMTVLKDKFFWNSPFFDAMRDVNAVYEVLSMCGFKSKEDQDPLLYLKNSVGKEGSDSQKGVDGRPYSCAEYVLPFSWARLQSPTFRYPDGTKLYDSIADWAKRASKMFFFDQLGMFHWEDSAGIAMSKGEGLPPLWKFCSGEGGEGQLTFNSYTKEGAVTDIYNDIHMITSTPNMEIISKGEINWPSIEDPKSQGFLGYRKVMLQQESFFGNEEAITNAIKYYKAFWKAPVVFSFETSGQPVRIFDMMSFDGNPLLVTSVSSDLDPKENKWWQQIQGEYFKGT